MSCNEAEVSQARLNGARDAAPRGSTAPGVRPLARPLVPVALALMAGIAAPAWGLSPPVSWLLGGGLVLWGLMAFCWWQGRMVRFLPLLFFGLLGAAFYQQARQPSFPPGQVTYLPQNQTINLTGHLYRPGKMGSGTAQLFMAARAWKSPWGWRPATGKVLVNAPVTELPPVGTGLVIWGRLHPPGMLHNPGTFNRPRYLAADGIFRLARLAAPDQLIFLAATEGYPLGERLRGGIRQRLRDLSPACRAMYLAMLLGDQGEITPVMRRDFARTGTSHLLVINGLHLGMVAAVTFFLSFWLLRRSTWLLLRVNVVKIATLLAAFPVVFYAWVAGGSPSTQRAEVMVLAYLMVVFLGRPGEVWSALALAALVILSLAPLRLFSISFQLSFVAVAFLIFLVPRLVAKLSWDQPARILPRPVAGLVFKAWEWLVVSVVAALATAPLVAAYFQIVSLLGVLVNLVAIPLVLLLALPLGEVAVMAQALSLPWVSQGLLWLGRLPLWLGYQVIQWGAGLPGSVVFVPTPSWGVIIAYYLLLILVFSPRRTYLTWTGASLAAVVLAGAVVWPQVTGPRVLEITCLDTYWGLRGVVVSPGGQRLVLSAAAPLRWGRPAPTWGPLPGYCHWRQFRRLDLGVALSLNEANAGELLTLARQFQVGSFWYGRRGPEGPQYYELWNYLGDRGMVPRSLARGQPPVLAGVDLKFIKAKAAAPPLVEIACQGRRVLLMPPTPALRLEDLPATGPWEALIIPASWGGLRERRGLISRLDPREVVVYGDPRPGGAHRGTWPVPCRFTRQGAVSLYVAAAGVTARQWRP